MKKKINQAQLENMIAECVGQVLAESRQPRQQKPARKVMNEAQLERYIQRIINEEMENEVWGGLGRLASKGADAISRGVKGAAGAVSNAAGAMGRGIKGAATSAGKAIGNAATSVGDAAQGAYNNVKQTYRNGEAISALKQMQSTMQKYGNMFPNKGAVTMINNGIAQLIQGVDSGDIDA